MPSFPAITERVFNTPLMVEPRKAAAFMRGLGPRLLDVDPSQIQLEGAPQGEEPKAAIPAFASLLGDEVAESIRDGWREGYAVRDGVAIVPVRGVLIHRGAWVGQSSGQTSYEGLRAQIDTALEDDRVKGIALEIDSFGGEVAGCFDLADRISEARRIKPVRAFVAENAYSAAYAIASQADRIIVSRTGGVGSIGVVCMHVDVSAALQEAGVSVTMVHAGKHKVDGNQYAPLPEAVLEEWTQEMEELRKLFAETVSDGRPALSVEAALATEARCYRADRAVEHVLADEVTEPRAAFRAFVEDVNSGAVSAHTSAPLAHQPGGPAMADQKTALAAEEQEDENLPNDSQVEEDEDDTSTDASEDEGEEEMTEEEDGTEASSERSRISAILQSAEAKANMSLAEHFAFKTDMSPAAAKEALKASGPTGGRLSDVMGSAEHPQLGSAPQGGKAEKSSADLMREKYGTK